MHPSRKTIDSRGLQISMNRTILLSQSIIARRPRSSLLSCRREFSWGSKHKNTTGSAGKVCKGFGTRDFAAKDQTRKQLVRGALWGDHHLHRYLLRHAPLKEWRCSSSWGKKSEPSSNPRTKAETNDAEDWFTRWEKQKMRQYDDFMKRVEHDPYTALFGRTWLRFSGESTEPEAAGTLSPKSSKETSLPKTKRTSDNSPSRSQSSSTRTPENNDICRRQPRTGAVPVQEHDQEFEIDPITNRKVPKRPATPLSTGGQIEPQVNKEEKASGVQFLHQKLASPIPTDHPSTMIERAQASPTSYQQNRETPLKPPNGTEWLTEEGFGNVQEPEADGQPRHQIHDAKSNITAAKIESALDRHLIRKCTDKKEKKDRPQLQYKLEENKVEDLDLLRPSDVRASAGLRGKLPKQTEVDKQARRQKLEEKYESCSLQPDGEATGGRLVQEREDHPAERSTATEFRFRSWLKGTTQDAKLREKEASKGTSAVWLNELSDPENFDPTPGDQASNSMSVSKNDIASETLNAVIPEAQAYTNDKTNKLKAQIVPFKAKLDAMKADYDSLRERWLQETRRVKEKAAKEEEQKAWKIAKRAREIHEEEIKAQKVAMEAAEIHSSNRRSNTTNVALANGVKNDDAKPAPRRLQSFLQGEGDMASNVHEFAGRDRWYKRKAPHAIDAKDVEMEAKLQKLATDRALIREIRGIYEDTYGTIDTKHRQPQLPSIPLTKPSIQLMNSTSGTIPMHTQLPSSTASRIESSRGLDESQSSRALEIVQKLFDQLREAQSVIQDYRYQSKYAMGPSGQNTNMFRPPDAFEKSVMQIVRTSEQLAKVKSGGIMDQGSIEAIAAANSKEPTINHHLSTTALESTNYGVQKATKLDIYSIPTVDPAKETVGTAGKFLTHVMSPGAKSYELDSGTSEIPVFKEEATPQELAEIKEIDVREKPDTPQTQLDLASGIPDRPNFYRNGSWQIFAPQKSREAQKQVMGKTEEETGTVEDAMKTATDRIEKKQQQSASLASRHTLRDKVHRQEALFSGSRQGRWRDRGARPKMKKRVAGRRRTTMTRMLMASAFTAACCYCVGVASELMKKR